jgi:hypothetical protein
MYTFTNSTEAKATLQHSQHSTGCGRVHVAAGILISNSMSSSSLSLSSPARCCRFARLGFEELSTKSTTAVIESSAGENTPSTISRYLLFILNVSVSAASEQPCDGKHSDSSVATTLAAMRTQAFHFHYFDDLWTRHQPRHETTVTGALLTPTHLALATTQQLCQVPRC